MVFCKMFKVVIFFYDMVYDVEIVNGIFDLDYCIKYDYEKVFVENVEGEYGIVLIYYVIFKYVVVVSIKEVVFCKVFDGNSGFDIVYLRGIFVVLFERICGNLINDEIDEYYGI